MRAAKGGAWKPSGSAKMLRWPQKCGGFLAGRKVTLVFYDGGVDKSNWGMHEFLVPVDTKITSLPLPPNKKYPRVSKYTSLFLSCFCRIQNTKIYYNLKSQPGRIKIQNTSISKF